MSEPRQLSELLPDAPPAKNRGGRPSLFSMELMTSICERLADGEPLAVICREPGMPDPSTVWDWERAHPEVSQAIARARDVGYDAIAVQGLEILDAPPAMVETEHGERVDPGDVALRKARFDGRMKLLSKWSPRYADRTNIDHGVQRSLADLIRESRNPAHDPSTSSDVHQQPSTSDNDLPVSSVLDGVAKYLGSTPLPRDPDDAE